MESPVVNLTRREIERVIELNIDAVHILNDINWPLLQKLFDARAACIASLQQQQDGTESITLSDPENVLPSTH